MNVAAHPALDSGLELRLLATLYRLARQLRPATPRTLARLLPDLAPNTLRSTLRTLVRGNYVLLKPVLGAEATEDAHNTGLAFPVLPQLTLTGFAIGAGIAAKEARAKRETRKNERACAPGSSTVLTSPNRTRAA